MHSQNLIILGIFAGFGEINLCSKKFPDRILYLILYVLHIKEVLNLRHINNKSVPIYYY